MEQEEMQADDETVAWMKIRGIIEYCDLTKKNNIVLKMLTSTGVMMTFLQMIKVCIETL